MTRTFAAVATVLLSLCLGLCLGACGGASSTPDSGTPIDAAVPIDASAPTDTNTPPPVDAWVPGSVTQTLAIGPFHVASGVEQTLCIAIDLGNDVPMMLRGVHTHISNGSHHLVVSRADTINTTPTPCPPLSHGIGEAIFIAESHESELIYPSYAGLPMAAHQVIGLELHMIDVEAEALDIAGMVDFDLVPVDPAIREVHILFTGPYSLHLPPHQQTVVTALFPMTPGTDVLAMTTHTHQLGIDSTLDITTDDSIPGTRIHESMSWSDPPLTLFDPPMRMGPADQVRLTCTFDNPGSSDVNFGTGFNDEMCFFWAYYLDPL